MFLKCLVIKHIPISDIELRYIITIIFCLVIPVYQFFTKLTSIVTFILGFCKHSDELAYASEIASFISITELVTRTGLNQTGKCNYNDPVTLVGVLT